MTENKRYRVFKYSDCNCYGVSDDVAEYTIARFDNHVEAEGLCNRLNDYEDENEQLKKELKKYTDAFNCSQCKFQNYDWFDDGDEFEVCKKGNNEAQMENHSCSEWEEI
ncbi:MAG: hypothetical protein IJH63_00820 [Methanobrevibacter sp.]|nr:hypothetical protein [Methanosphaera sp.]MBR0369247.1 hypothetical protein [Methanobrevibacter sp.]